MSVAGVIGTGSVATPGTREVNPVTAERYRRNDRGAATAPVRRPPGDEVGIGRRTGGPERW